MISEAAHAAPWRESIRNAIDEVISEGSCQLDYLFSDYPWAMVSIRVDQEVFCSPRAFRNYMDKNQRLLDRWAFHPDPKVRQKRYLKTFKKLLPKPPEGQAVMTSEESKAFSKDLLETLVSYELSYFKELEIVYALGKKTQKRVVKKTEK